jgi:hypothetical protein
LSDEKSVVRRPRPGIAGVPNQVAGALRPRPSLVAAAPGLARFAAVSAWHAVGWSVGAAFAGASYVARRTVDGEPAMTIIQDAANDLRDMAWRALGMQDGMLPDRPLPNRDSPRATQEELYKRGSDLLRRSNDVHVVEDTHPAFARILSDITPDEARILRFLYLEGPQPAVDVRTYRPLGIGSELVAGGLNMIAEHAGCRNLDRTSLYLTNLNRLGLIDFSKEQVSNPSRYQVIEAQPKVTEAMKRAGRMPRTVHRSIHLNQFGEEFVRTCLPLNPRVIPHREPKQLPTDV